MELSKFIKTLQAYESEIAGKKTVIVKLNELGYRISDVTFSISLNAKRFNTDEDSPIDENDEIGLIQITCRG